MIIPYGKSSLNLRKSGKLSVLQTGRRESGGPEATAVGSREHSRIGDYVVLERDTERSAGRGGNTAAEAFWGGVPTPIYHASRDEVPFIPTGTLYVEFAERASNEEKAGIISRQDLTLVSTDADGAVTLRVNGAGRDAVEVSAALQAEPAVKIAEPDLLTEGEVKHFTPPDDPLFARQWHLENSGRIGDVADGMKAGADGRVVAAWRRIEGFGSERVVIGIIDDGFDLAHPDLATRIIAPWDFRRGTANVAPEPNLASPTQGNWHGTACAGVAVGALDGGKIVGAAPGCSWLPVRWSTLEPLEIVKWFDYMREKGAWVVSCSWGARDRNYPLSTRVEKAIRRCATEGRDGRGCVILFAAGNEDRDINDPGEESVNGFAIHPDVAAVSASTSMDERAPYSNFGKAISICAPSSGGSGQDVTTADVVGDFMDAIGMNRPRGYVPGDYFEHFGKTSSACPLVAGICGLMLSVNAELTAAQVRDILKRTARRIGAGDQYDAEGHSNAFGYGCANAEAAVAEALALVPSA